MCMYGQFSLCTVEQDCKNDQADFKPCRGVLIINGKVMIIP